jgi:hypothetical protein
MRSNHFPPIVAATAGQKLHYFTFCRTPDGVCMLFLPALQPRNHADCTIFVEPAPTISKPSPSVLKKRSAYWQKHCV